MILSMFLKIRQDECTLYSEDAADVEYLLGLFGQPINVTIEHDHQRLGFHCSNEQKVRVTFKRAKEL